jgi:hypothetical protein
LRLFHHKDTEHEEGAKLAKTGKTPATFVQFAISGLRCLHVLPHNDEILLGSEAAAHVQVHL